MFAEGVIWLNGGLLWIVKAGVGYWRILEAGCNTKCKGKQENASWEQRKMFVWIDFQGNELHPWTEKGSHLCHSANLHLWTEWMKVAVWSKYP